MDGWKRGWGARGGCGCTRDARDVRWPSRGGHAHCAEENVAALVVATEADEADGGEGLEQARGDPSLVREEVGRRKQRVGEYPAPPKRHHRQQADPQEGILPRLAHGHVARQTQDNLQ